MATGEPAESDRTKITVFTLIGQVVYFRIGREAVMRRMGWSDIGPDEADEVIARGQGQSRAAILRPGKAVAHEPPLRHSA